MPIKEALIFPVFGVIKEASKINQTKFKQALNFTNKDFRSIKTVSA